VTKIETGMNPAQSQDSSKQSTDGSGHAPGQMGFKQFVALIASIMAVNALAIDAMVPALGFISSDLHIVAENDRQWIITAYMLGFGSAQIVYGTLADRFGRKLILQLGTAAYVIFSLIAAASTSFEMLLAARALQGIGAAASRVLVVSIVRDRYAGRQMARVMSLTMIVFLAVPILAPSIGQVILLIAPGFMAGWRWIFVGLATFGTFVMLWVGLRLPETLHAEDRVRMTYTDIARAFRTTLTNRIAVGYMIAMTCVVGGLFGFINSAQQVFVEVFKQPVYFTLIFAVIAGFMAISSLLNARIVSKYGTRRISHAALLGYTGFTLVHMTIALMGIENLWTFTILQSGMMFCFGLMASNFSSMAMEPLGHVAGTASSVQGFVTTIGAAALGFYVGQHFDGTVKPLMIGFFVCALAGLVVVLITERGKLFQPTASGLASAR
jgi:DHA1 family bicyclomycin/chloramphenicol resistance-like MFS transporter